MTMSAQAQLLESGAPTTLEFTFKHRVFSAEGAVFRKTSDGSDVALVVPLGDVVGTLPIATLRASFNIAAESEDGKLLAKVVKAMRFMREIHPGDSIPSEIIDGSGSWMVDEKYLVAAKARIALRLVAWLQGEDVGQLATHELIAKAENPETRQMVQNAFGAAATKLGYAEDQRGQIVDLVGRLANEYSYIEALRDRFDRLKRLIATLKLLYGAYSRERATQDMITRCNTLLVKPAQKIFALFDAVDANTGEILQTLRNYQAQVDYIRKTRDTLRELHLMWEDILERWEDVEPSTSPAAEVAIRDTYRFAARHFSQATTWSMSL
jgi:hypothetical protein